MKRALAVMAGLVLLACGVIRPPHPQPTPTPTPTPQPTSTPPPTGGAAIQFGTSGGAWTPKSPRGFVGCCNTPAQDGALGWTFADQHEIDAYASAGGTLAVFRTGPYSDQGNGWGMIMSPPGQESRLRRACKYANSKGIACIVEAGTDHWSLKKQNTAFQMYNDTCDITHSGPPERYHRWSRAVVKEVGDLKVLWSLGNEGWLCNPSRTWYDGLVHVIRTAEQDFGFPSHPIGNVYKAGEVGSILYDFVEVHGPPEAFCNMPDPGVPVIWTESENENPPESPGRMLQAQTCADNSGNHKASLLWRGGIEDPQWEQIFSSLGGHAPAKVARHDSSCLWNQWAHTYNGTQGNVIDEATLKRMQQAVENVIARIGPDSWLFVNGGNNLRSKGDASDEYQRIDYFSMLDAMQDGCTIVGNPEAASGNALWEVDNIESFLNPDPCAQSGLTVAWHAIIQGNPGNYNQVVRGENLRNYPSVFKGRQSWTVNDLPCTAGPGPQPTPTPGPTPTPTPPPSQSCGAIGGNYCSGTGACPAGYSSLGNTFDCAPCCKTATPTPSPTPTPTTTCGVPDYYRVVVKSNSTNQQYDVTAVACGGSTLGAPGVKNCGTSCCELSAEKGNAVCSDILYGQPTHTVIGGDALRLVQVYTDNSFTMKVNPPEGASHGAGRVKICGRDARSCVFIDVITSPPVCDINRTPNQGCAVNVQ